jgi:deoxyribodipyrimidine photolyase
MVAADFLTKRLSIHCREGAARFAQRLADGVVANNMSNRPWVARAGTNGRQSRPLSPEQVSRFDADGAFVRRHVRELGTPDHRLPLG